MTVPALDLRPYRPGDLLALYEVCLRTGNSGDDAQALYRDPLLLGHIYAAPYATLCPDTTFVLQGGARVVGYVLGVGYRLPQGLELGLRYNGGLAKLADGSSAPELHNSVFQLQVGYLFGKQ